MPKQFNKKKTIPAAAATAVEAQRNQAPQIFHQQQVVHTRTIFDPEVLERYSRLVPDAPERVLHQFELNGESERTIQAAILAAQKADNRRRDWMAFAVIIAGLLLAALTGWLGIPWLSGASLATIVAYAIFGYLSKPKAPPPPKQ